MPDLQEIQKVIESLEFDCISPIASPREYITHEMALDAQDKELEGQIYREESWERCGSCPQCMFNQLRPDLIKILSRIDKKDFNIICNRELCHPNYLFSDLQIDPLDIKARSALLATSKIISDAIYTMITEG